MTRRKFNVQPLSQQAINEINEINEAKKLIRTSSGPKRWRLAKVIVNKKEQRIETCSMTFASYDEGQTYIKQNADAGVNVADFTVIPD